MIRYSTARGPFDSNVVMHEVENFHELVERICGEREFVATKENASFFFCCTFKPGSTTKKKANVEAVHFLCADFDEASEEQLHTVLQKIAAKYTSYLYTTYSHKPAAGINKVRVILPVSRPVTVDEMPYLHLWLYEQLCNKACDAVCKDASRGYYAPSSPSPRHEYADTWLNDEGESVDVEEAIAYGKVAAATSKVIKKRAKAGSAIEKVSVENLTDFVRILRRNEDHKTADIIAKMRDGDIFAQVGEMDNCMFEACTKLLLRFPQADLDHLGALLSLSVEKTAEASSKEDVDANLQKLQDKLERAQAYAQENYAGEALEEVSREEAAVRQAFEGIGVEDRTSPYTLAEMEVFAETCSVSGAEEMTKRWIIQNGNSYYIFVNGSYQGPYGYMEIVNKAHADLAPARIHGVEFEPDIKPNTLVGMYGTVAKAGRIEIGARQSSYDSRTQIITEATAPMISAKPEFIPEADEYLRALGGPDYHQLVQWMTVVPMIKQPLLALYLYGPPGAGKSILAQGIARLWGGPPTDASNAFRNFNGALVNNPVVLMDENTPKAVRNNTGLVRQFISATNHTIERKGQETVSAYGCARLIIAANNKNLMNTNESLSYDDAQAIGQRFLMIQVGREASDFFLNQGGRAGVGRTLVEDLGLARHALYLAELKKAEELPRFGVAVNDERMAQHMAASAGPAQTVLEWIAHYIIAPVKMVPMSNHQKPVIASDGQVWIGQYAMARLWSSYMENGKPVTAKFLADAINTICTGDIKRFAAHPEQVYKQLNREMFRIWCENHGNVDFDIYEKFVTQPEGGATIHDLTKLMNRGVR